MNADKVNFKDTMKTINVEHGLLDISGALSFCLLIFIGVHRRLSAANCFI